MDIKYLVIIPTFNRRDELRATIRSMHFLQHHPDVKLVVIDDGSTDGTLKMLGQEFPFVLSHKNEKQQGPSYSRNWAAKNYKADYYIFLDSDIEVPYIWWKVITKNLAPHHVLAGKIVNLYTKDVEVGPRCSTFFGGSVPCSPERANVGSSCHLIVPASCFHALDGFDEEIPYYFEDSDLCIRAQKTGYPVKYLDEAVIYHKNQGHKKGKRIQMHVQNRTYAMSKAYQNMPLKLITFFIFNTMWVSIQSGIRGLHLQFHDSLCIWRGWISGNRMFIKRVIEKS